MAEYNPFAQLAPMTPEGLAATREVAFEEQTKGQSFWAQEAGRAGLDARRRLMSQGVALSPDDERAITSQSIMQGAQKRLAHLVESGEVDPMDAQERVISETMSAFMAAGDYSAAQSFLPSLNQIRTYRDEQAKLRAETYEKNTAGFENVQDAGLSADKAATERGMLAVNQAKAAAEGEYNLAGVRQRDADARLKDRTDPNIRGGGGGSGGGGVGIAEARQVREMGAATMTLFQAMNDLSNYMDKAPFVASAGGKAAAGARNWVMGAKALFAKRGGSMGGFAALSDRAQDGRDGTSPKAIVEANRPQVMAAAAKLGITDVTAFESLVIDAAYAIARANDPGGRLSNNDFDQAVKMLGAVQDPVAAKKAFKALGDRAAQKFRARRDTFKPEVWEAEFGDMDRKVESQYDELVSRWGTRVDAAPPAPDADGWTTLQNGTRIRKKPK